MSGEKKSGKNTGREKESRGKISSGKNLVTCKNLVTFPRLFFPDKVFYRPEHNTKGGPYGTNFEGPQMQIWNIPMDRTRRVD